MAKDLAKFADSAGVKYFMISYTDLFGAQRAKLVPAAAIKGMQADGAGFAAFASWLDSSPAAPDMLAVPDPATAVQLPWKPEVGVGRRQPDHGGRGGRPGPPQTSCARRSPRRRRWA